MTSWISRIFVILWAIFSDFVTSTTQPVRLRLPSAFSRREVGPTALIQEFLAALQDVELDAVVDVVLVGNFASDAVPIVSSALDAEASLRVSSVGLHAYEKIVYHVSAASRPTTLSVSESLLKDSYSDFIAILTDHHRNQGSAVTLFVIELPDNGEVARRPWAQAWMDDLSACHGITNARAEGIAWIFVPSRLSYIDKHVTKSSFGFDGAFALDVAVSVQSAVGALVPSIQTGIERSAETRFGVEYLHISICSSYSRLGACPEDSVVGNALRRVADAVHAKSKAAGVGDVKISSASFNVHDFPELLSVIQSSVHYAPSRGGRTSDFAVIDVKRLLQGLMQSARVRSTIQNKIYQLQANERRQIIPVFDVYLPAGARVESRSGRFVERVPTTLDGGGVNAHLILDAIIRVKQNQDNLEGFNIIDYFATTNYCLGASKLPLSSVGTQLLDSLLQSAFRVSILGNTTQIETLGERSVVFVTEDTSKASIAINDPYYYDPKNDFRIVRAVGRAAILQKTDSVLLELRTLLQHASAHFDTLCNASGYGATMYPIKADKSIFTIYKDARGSVHEVAKVDSRHYASMANVRKLSCMEMVGYTAFLMDKAAESYSHLDFEFSSEWLDSASVVVAALGERSAELLEQSRRATHVSLECFARESELSEEDISDDEEEEEAEEEQVEMIEDGDVSVFKKQQQRSAKGALMSALLRSSAWGVVAGVVGFLALKAASMIASAESARAASAETGIGFGGLPAHRGSDAYFLPRKPL